MADYNFVSISFADAKIPEFKEVAGKDWIKFGEFDNFPDYLLMLANKSAKHGAILNNKSIYIYGNGLASKVESHEADKWLKCANQIQTWNELADQTIKEIELFGGFYWQIIPNLSGKYYYILIPFSKVRVSKCGEKYYVKNDWKNNREEMKCYPKFYEGCKEATIFQYKEYRPASDNRYPLPNYFNALNYIESDVEVSKHTLTNAKTGFSASKLITFPNGEPDEEKKRSIKRRFNNAYTGAEGEKLILQFAQKAEQAAIVADLGQSDLTKEDFSQVDQLITNNIFIGHSVTSPILFGVQQEGKLGNTQELRTAFDIFKSTYANKKQQALENIISYFASLEKVNIDIEFKQIDPIGFEFGENVLLQAAPKSWLLEKMGIDTEKYPDTAVGGATQAQPIASEAMAVNEHLRNLTGKQMQGYERIKRKYRNGQMSKEEATVFLKSYGLSDEDIAVALGEPQQFMSDDEGEFIFAKFGEQRSEFDLIESKPLNFEANIDEQISAMQFGILDRLKKIPTFQIRYSYEWRSIVPANQRDTPEHPSRPFCHKLMALDRYYSREDIQRISALVGYNVFDRAGGFWNHNGKTDKQCRHEWKANIVIKRK